MITKFENKKLSIDSLAEALSQSRLALFLGAGVSKYFGLPDWNELIENLCKASGVAYTKTKSEDLARLCKKELVNDKAYNSKVKEILYENFKIEKIIDYPLLVAIGAMSTGSKVRGVVSNIVTYNFDDVLEKYFYYYGIIPEVIKEFPYYEKKSDVRIIHPHGYLPFNETDDSEIIALDTSTLSEARRSKTFWPELENIVKHNVLLFIGISFKDENLKELIENCKKEHPSNMRPDEPIGFYFVKSSDIEDSCSEVDENRQKIDILKLDKIYPIVLDNWSQIPHILCNICQGAMRIH